MTCKHVQYSLSAHLDGCLSVGERQAVSEHSGRCPGVPASNSRVAQVRAAVGSLAPAVPPPHTEQRVARDGFPGAHPRLARQHPFREFADRFRLWADNLMRAAATPWPEA